MTNGNIQTTQISNNKVLNQDKSKDFEKQRLPTEIFGGIKKQEEEEKIEEKKSNNPQIHEIVEYLSEISEFKTTEETAILNNFLKKCFSANRADLITQINKNGNIKRIEYRAKGTNSGYIADYEKYIVEVLNELILEKEKTPEIKNIFNAINKYDIKIAEKLLPGPAEIIYKMHCETEQGRYFLKNCKSDLAKKNLNEYYLDVLSEKLTENDFELKEEKE
jgi:hypothetical protein